MNSSPKVSIVIPTYNRKKKLSRLINSILYQNYNLENLELVIVDDASNDDTFDYVTTELTKIAENYGIMLKYIRHKKPLLIAKSRCDGILHSSYEFVFFIDDDNVVHENCLKELVRVLIENPDIGVVGPITLYLSDKTTIQYAGAIYAKFTRKTIYLLRNKPLTKTVIEEGLIEVDGIPNSFMIRRSLALKVNLIPWEKIPWNGEDGYLQYKIKKSGFRIVVNPRAWVYHDAPRDVALKYNEMRLYYALRSKIFFHRHLDELFNKVFFTFFLPLYLLWYIYIATRCENRLKCLKAVLEGFFDGIFGKSGIKYV